MLGMSCSACGAAVPSDAAFCPKCGAALRASPAADDERRTASGVASRVQAAAARAEPVEETEIWKGSYTPQAMLGTWIGIALLTVVLIAVSVIVPPAALVALPLAVLLWVAGGLLLMYRRLSIHYRLTSRRFFCERGILSRTTDRMDVIDMDDVSVQQDLLGRMLGFGTIRIVSSDRTSPDLKILGVADVQKVADLFDGVRLTERRRRGLFVEQI